ncbi:MAG: signal peptide peptidase SppA [Caulobacterales bacterium]|uniref:signal peptide peptidase SppA n=1 Tax=Glycocaulis sp. TaxID=1969725 RepID=UPI003F9F767C
MRQFWITFFGSVAGVIVGAVLTVLLLGFMLAALIASAAQQASEGRSASAATGDIVLQLDLRRTRLDQPSRSPFAFAEPLSVVDLVTTLQRAQGDERVRGVFVRANEFGMSPAQAEEIGAALTRFSESGRFVIAHAQGFEGTGITNYFAVSGADEIWMQDTSTFAAVGLASESLFLGGLFEQFGMQAEFLQFYEYKNAANTYTEDGFTEAHLEATTSYMNAIFESALAVSAADREMEAGTFRDRIVSGPHSAEAAREAGLVDALGHPAAARNAALERAGENATLQDIETYARNQVAPAQTRGPVIAMISGQGSIVTGGGETGLGGGSVIGGDAMADAIDSAAGSDDVRAIIVRVDSGGGSAIASDQIWNAVVRAREAGKPVIVSMASLAASGGYYLAAPADMIIANATTLTGSIGVVFGKVVIDGALDQVGVNIEPVAVGGEFATAYSSQTPFSETQRASVEAMASEIYDDFTGRVAEGRDLPITRVREIARGRVWTGAQALELGLVDRIGGLHEAIEAARELAGISADETVRLRHYPRQPTPMEALQQLFGLTAEGAEAASQLSALLNLPEVRAALEARDRAEARGAQMRTDERAPR